MIVFVILNVCRYTFVKEGEREVNRVERERERERERESERERMVKSRERERERTIKLRGNKIE